MKINLQFLFNAVKNELFSVDASDNFINTKTDANSPKSENTTSMNTYSFANPTINLAEGIQQIMSETQQLDEQLAKLKKILNNEKEI